ncbi:MAG TPA: LysM peptidoglycan-binding domain-containing protein, partial [Thermoanaerobaculia bacterium]|nr:LysM peptidoglycan-binding domain-containing protein [Thermoanaerobaculia bacterium]
MTHSKACAPWCVGLLLLATAGCSSAPSPKVKITYTDIEPKAQAVPPAAEPVVDPALAGAVSPEERAKGALPALGAPISTKQAMEQALAWTAEGLRQYEKGDSEAAHKSLTDARIMLLEADLPDFLETQGLGALRPGLPEELRRYDVESILRDLERTDRPNTAERAERAVIDREVRRILWQFGDTSPDERYLTELIDETQQYISFFRGRYRPFFERAFLRKHKYWPTIQDVFTAKKIPPDLAYVALVESGFNPRALSRANAIGLWQFIPETGKRYGLQSLDEFYDVRKSTTAAADYLLDLISIFGSRSFLLATAAYNAGEGKIMGCLRKIDDPFQRRDFWEIRGCLALETQEYVPKIMAAAVIGADPKRFGFDLPSEEEMRQRYDVVLVPQVTSLARLAELAGVGVADLRSANNDLDASATFTPGRNFPLYVPVGSHERIASALAAAPEERLPTVAAPAPVELAVREAPQRATRSHTVRRGDTLGAVAEKYGLDVKTLADSNDLRKPYTLNVGQRLEIPAGRGEPSRVVYTVKSGNSLKAVAELFAVSDQDIKSWNDLRSSKLKAGQKLTIHPTTTVETKTYKVRRGDTLVRIAQRFAVSVEHLMTANGLKSSILRTGQQL